MPKLIDLLNKKKMTLIVSLPKNEVELAQAAQKGGADALLLNVNAAGFGSLEEEQANLTKILDSVDLPLGINVGYKDKLSDQGLQAVKALKFDFFSLKFQLVDPGFKKITGISRIISLHSDFNFDNLLNMSALGADALDAAIVPAAQQGAELKVGDLQNYISIILAAGVPVIIPTQKDIKPSEVAIISDAGAKGLLLTPVVTGTTLVHIEKNIREFRIAADDLGD